MSSLADLPEVTGFFSYSRDDDAAYKGRLSVLRDAIQDELSAQLGRSKATFRLFQDKENIAPGTLWESEITKAVERSVFFIPIVTPRAVNSQYCQFEFDAFLRRENVLGRTDLVFPILYVPVPALGIEAQWRNHPVLSVIGKRQYVDWQTFRFSDIPTPAMWEAIASFASRIVEALHQSWLPPEERKQQQESEARVRVEQERRRQEAEAKFRAEDEALRKAANMEAQRIAKERLRQEEQESRQRGESERRRQEIEDRRRAEEEALRKRPKPEARRIAKEHGEAVGEAEAYAEIANRYDVTVLEDFLDRYPSGKRADQVRSRLRVLNTQRNSVVFLPIVLGVLVFLAVLGVVLMASGVFHK